MSNPVMDNYQRDQRRSIGCIARALRLYRSGLLDEAWIIAKADPLLVPGTTREQWLAWAAKIISDEQNRRRA